MNTPEVIKELISNEMGLTIPDSAVNIDDIRQLLAEKFNELIDSDFEHLIQLLYRIDISEAKLKQVLKENPGKNTADLLAELTIERQLQKIRSRQEYRPDENISDDE